MYCSDKTLKDYANEGISKSEKRLAKNNLQEKFDEIKSTSQEGPADAQQDQVLPDDSLILTKTIPERSSVTLKSIISDVENQKLFSPSEKPDEIMADSCKISLPDPTVLTTVRNILLRRDQSQNLEDHEAQKLSSSSLLSETSSEKSSLASPEDEKAVEKKTASKVHKESTMLTTPSHSAVTDMTFSRDQHLFEESNQNLSHSHFLYKNQCERSSFSKADDVKGDKDTESTDSFRKSSKGIITGSHEKVPLSDSTSVTNILDIHLNQSKILFDQAQTQQAPKFSTKVSTLTAESTEKPSFEEPGISTPYVERVSLSKSTKVHVLSESVKPQLAKAELEAEIEDIVKSSSKSFMKTFTLKGKDEFSNETSKNLFTKKTSPKSFDDNKHTPKRDSLEVQQDQPSNDLPYECTPEAVTKVIPYSTAHTKERDTLLTKYQSRGLEVQQEQQLPGDSLTPLKKSSIVRNVGIQEQLTHRTSKNVAVGTHEDGSLQNGTALTHVTGVLSAEDQKQIVVEGKQDKSLPHDVLFADVKRDKAQSITIGSSEEIPSSGPSTTKSPTFSEIIAVKPVLDKIGINISESSKKLSVTIPKAHVQNTKCQLADTQREAGDIDSIKILSKSSILKPYTLERSDEFRDESLDNVTKTALQMQGFSDHKYILHEYPLEGQHDQNLPSNSMLFKFTPERTSLTSVELQQQSISDKPSVRLTHSAEITLPGSHTDIKDILLARDQPQDSKVQQDKKPPCDPIRITNNTDVFLSSNLNQEQTKALGLSFSTSSKDRESLPARSADVSVQTESTTSQVEEAQLYAEDVGTIESSLKQLSLESAGVVSESSEFTKKASVQTQWFNYHKHTGHDYSLKNEKDQQLPSNASVLDLTNETPLGTWPKSVVVGVDVQQKPAASGKPSEKNERSFKVTSPDAIVYAMSTGITLSRDQQGLEKLPSDSFLLENTPEKSSVAWFKSAVSDAEIQEPSLSSQKPSESIIDPIPLTKVTNLSRDQVPLEDKQAQMLSNDTFVSKTMHDNFSIMGLKSDEVQQPLAHFERSSSHKEVTLTDSTISQDQKESKKFAILHQDTQNKYPCPSVTLYPGISADYAEISDTSSKPLQSMHFVQNIVESPTMLLTSPSAEDEETAFEESFVGLCQLVTQKINDLNIKTNEVAKFVCYINPQTHSSAVWYHNDKKLATTERIKFDQSGNMLSLLICDVQPEDQGIYCCVVKNKDGKTQTTSAQLNIEGGYLPCNHLIPNHHSGNIHIIPCHFVFMPNLDDLF